MTRLWRAVAQVYGPFVNEELVGEALALLQAPVKVQWPVAGYCGSLDESSRSEEKETNAWFRESTYLQVD